MLLKILLIVLLPVSGCATTGNKSTSLEETYKHALARFEAKKYEEAIDQLGKFKSRHPYSNKATTAELLIADSFFALKHYQEALYAYQQFAQLHPHHPQRPYALFQVGNSYWAEAPKAVNRAQENTRKAINVWRNLIKEYPQHENAAQAEQMLESGERRLAKSYALVASFYCAQKIYHACAYRHLALATKFTQFPDLRVASYNKAADALEHVLQDLLAQPTSTANVYARDYTPHTLRQFIVSLRQKSKQ